MTFTLWEVALGWLGAAVLVVMLDVMDVLAQHARRRRRKPWT